MGVAEEGMEVQEEALPCTWRDKAW